MREKLPVPQLWDSPTITSIYVDNVAIIGARKKDVENRAQGKLFKFGLGKSPPCFVSVHIS